MRRAVGVVRGGAPWLLSAVFAASTAWLWWADGPRAAPRRDAAEGTVRVGRPPSDRAPIAVAPLARCVDRLRVVEALLATCRAPPAAPVGAPDDDAARCLRDPRVRGHLDAQVQAALERHVHDEGARYAAASAQRLAQTTSLTRDILGLTDAEASRLGNYICLLRDLRALMGRRSVPSDGGTEATFEQLRREREDVLATVERELGSERFRRLRAVGGVGLLSEALDCH